MGYSVKWVVENLGISRDMLRYYEKENLITTEETRNPTNKYRDYSDEDIERIWGIKLLIGIGFTAKEIHALMNDDDFDFDAAITNKVAELERKHDENVINLQFAKSIKLTGRIPTTTKIGSIRFNDFLAYAHDNWNIYDDPRFAPFMQLSDALISKAPQGWGPDDEERFLGLFENLDTKLTTYFNILLSYYQVISDMRELEYSSDTVQQVVRLAYKYMVEHALESEHDENFNPVSYAKYTALCFIYGDAAASFREYFGEEGCVFLANAIAYFGGYACFGDIN